MSSPLGLPHRHQRCTASTNAIARALAAAGAPHGTLVTADEQLAGRGRQGRRWHAPAGQALLMSLVVRDPPPMLAFAAAVAVAEIVGADAAIKWPNDVFSKGRKVAGILIEARPQQAWAVLGIGLNVAVEIDQLPSELRASAGTLGLGPESIEPTLCELLVELERWLAMPARAVRDAWSARDALAGQKVGWGGGEGIASGIDDSG
ncbi:MAG: biotin--[acetyl-CoA-carboxylase] ligase, partial [Solirubrobacterales bacterium]